MKAANRLWSIGVVVPAQNEANTIERCVESIIEAHRACSGPFPLWLVVVADRCDDDTVHLARRAIAGRGQVVECDCGSPGTARRLGVAAVIEHFHHVAPACLWIANTDADTHVPRDWLRLHLELADEGVSAVAGIVQLDAATERSDILRLYRDTYELGSDGTHGHVHGANLGVRGDAYLDVGGWSNVSVAEDHCLWGRLQLRGWQLRSCVTSVVMTSARLHGRAVGGFADTLRRELGFEHG